jgi:hypothetical protein
MMSQARNEGIFNKFYPYLSEYFTLAFQFCYTVFWVQKLNVKM